MWMMQTKVHPAIEGLCFLLFWVPFLWSMLNPSIPDGGEQHRPLALLPCPMGTPDAGPEETPQAEQGLGIDEDTAKRELGEGSAWSWRKSNAWIWLVMFLWHQVAAAVRLRQEVAPIPAHPMVGAAP